MPQSLCLDATSACRDGCHANVLRDVLEPLCNEASRYFRYTGRLGLTDGACEAAGAAQRYVFDLLANEFAPPAGDRRDGWRLADVDLDGAGGGQPRDAEFPDRSETLPLWSRAMLVQQMRVMEAQARAKVAEGLRCGALPRFFGGDDLGLGPAGEGRCHNPSPGRHVNAV